MKPLFQALRASHFRLSAPVLALAGALALPARAGVVMTGEHKPLDGSQPTTYKASVDAGLVRVETGGQHAGIFIYRADKGLLWMVNPAEKSYTEMTKADIEAMAGQFDAARKQMQDQLANMPPEQRAMVEKMMPGLAAGKEPKISYKKTGTAKSGSWSCDKYEMLADGAKRAEVCWVDPTKAGMTMADYKTITDLAKPFEKIAKDLQAMFPQPGVNGAPEAVPVKTTIFEEGKAHSEAVVKEIRKETFAANFFEVPKGYTKQAMPGMGGQQAAPKAKKGG